MQTYSQIFAGAQTWQLNVPGRYFTTIGCSNPINVRLYKAGKLLDLGEIKGLLAGLEIERVDFDRVEVDATGADTITIGVGNGNARYNRGASSITSMVPPRSAAFSAAAKTVTNVSAQLVAANTSRTYLLIQNNDATGDIYIQFGAAATVAHLKIPAGGMFEMNEVQSTQEVRAIGSIANNANVVVVEG